MQTWTITYEDENEDGTYTEVRKITMQMPDLAGILRDAHWTSWLVRAYEPDEGEDEMSEKIDPTDIVVYQGSGEWSALYVKGRLVEVGDHYLAEEKIHQLLGIEVRQSDAFMCGGDYREDVASTIEEIQAYSDERQRLDDQAAYLERQAQELEARAAALRKQKPGTTPSDFDPIEP